MVRTFPGRPFLLDVHIKRFQARFPFWPPPDASPAIAIEPWGKQFFVYNGIRNVEIKSDSRAPEWGPTRPKWWQEDIALSLQLPGEDPNEVLSRVDSSEDLNSSENQTHTHLCVTDFRRRPLFYLNSDEFKVFREHLNYMKEQIEKFKTQIPSDEAKKLDVLNYKLEDNKYLHIRRGRVMNPPSRSGRGVMKSPNRPPKSKMRK